MLERGAHDHLLGDAERKASHVRGFAAWNPRGRTRELLTTIDGVLKQYEDYLPITVRQLFYRLVGAHGYSKNENAYEVLIAKVNRARRAKLVPMESIRDDGGHSIEPERWEDAEDFLAAVRQQAAYFKLDRQAGQPLLLIVTCEAAGMAPQLSGVADLYGVPVFSSGGFESTTARFRLAERIAYEDRPVEVLDIGDHDASGVHRFITLAEDVEAFVRDLGGAAQFVRLAVIPEQIRHYRLPTAPPKRTDRRAFEGPTAQAEALPPDVLAGIVRQAIEERMDLKVYRQLLKREAGERRELLERLGR